MIITDQAQKRIREVCAVNEWFRVTVSAGGCSGFEHDFQVTCTVNPDQDLVLGQVCVDFTSAELLQNAILDWRSDLSGSSFVLTVPEATSSCGCGKSFGLF